MPSKSARKRSWKNIQSQSRVKKKTKLALLILGLVLLLLILGQTVHLIQTLFSPWRLSTNLQRNYSWDGKFNINLVVHSNSTSLLSYNPKDKKIIIINIPEHTFLQVPHGFGKWELRAVYDLGKAQNGRGSKLLKETLTRFLAIPIDGFLDVGGSLKSKNADELIEILRKNPFSGTDLLANLQTDLTLWELIRLKVSLASVRFDKVLKLNLDKLNVLEKASLLDGTPIFNADEVKLDNILASLQDPAIVSEYKSIAVFNATDHPQLAERWVRLITNLGGHVIITANANKRLKKTELLGEQSVTLTRLKQIFNLNDKISSQVEDLAFSRAQINLLLGEDYSD